MGVEHSIYSGIGYATKESVVHAHAESLNFDDDYWNFYESMLEDFDDVDFFVAGTYYSDNDNDVAVVLTRGYTDGHDLQGLVTSPAVEVTASERKALRKAFKKLTGFKPEGEPRHLLGGLWH